MPLCRSFNNLLTGVCRTPVQMSSQGDDDDDLPHDTAPVRGGAFTISAHDGNGWPSSTGSNAIANQQAEARAATARGSKGLLRPVMRPQPNPDLAGGRGHYADRSSAQPDQPEELLQVMTALKPDNNCESNSQLH